MNIIDKTESKAAIDFERYRLRRFLAELPRRGDRDQRRADRSRRRRAGARRQSARRACSAPSGRSATSLSATSPAAAAASRTRSALRRTSCLQEVQRRLRNRPEIVEVSRAEAPAQEVVLTGSDADLTTLAGASAARRRRRALHLRVDRFRRRSQDRLDQCRHPPPDAARPHARPASISIRRATCARSTRRARPPASRCRSPSWSARTRSIISPP